MNKPIDESDLPLIFWVILLVGINALWIWMDLWLHRHGHEYLTIEVREILDGGGWRALLFCAFVGATAGLIFYHFFWQRLTGH